jgi:hypothetical protein
MPRADTASIPKGSPWPRTFGRNKPRFESWVDDLFEYLLRIASVVVAFAVFRGMAIQISSYKPRSLLDQYNIANGPDLAESARKLVAGRLQPEEAKLLN